MLIYLAILISQKSIYMLDKTKDILDSVRFLALMQTKQRFQKCSYTILRRQINEPLRTFSSITLVIFSTTTVLAQTGNSTEARGGSIYSAIGVGFPVDNTSSGLLSQGILELHVNRETSSLANPIFGHKIFTHRQELVFSLQGQMWKAFL